MTVKHKPNRVAVETDIDRLVRGKVVEAAAGYERILQESFREAKTGRVYGAEEEVTFRGTAGGEKEVLFPVALRKPSTGKKWGVASFTANKGQKAAKRQIKFVANRGKTLGGKGRLGAGVHQASAPGEAPAIDTGALRKGVTSVLVQIAKCHWSSRFGVSVQSGRGAPTGTSQRSVATMLEFGTVAMKERPAWRPSLEKFRAGYRAAARKVARKKAGK